MTDEEIMSAGYKRWKRSAIDSESVECFFQKRITDESGIRYFINIKKWNFSEYKHVLNGFPEISYEGETKLYMQNTHDAINISCSSHINDIKTIETIFNNLWNTGMFEHYERWN